MDSSKNKLDPDMKHFTSSDYKSFYEPSDDTWFFVDCLDKEFRSLRKDYCYFVIEIGSGSGFVSTYVHRLLSSIEVNHCSFCSDINIEACEATRKTFDRNCVTKNFDIMKCNFCSPFQENTFDFILFNPPYVPSEDDEMGKDDLTCSYAGGKDGREVIDVFLLSIKKFLKDNGSLYMICIDDNYPQKIIEFAKAKCGFTTGEIVGEKQVIGEYLYLLKFTKSEKNE